MLKEAQGGKLWVLSGVTELGVLLQQYVVNTLLSRQRL